MCKLLVLAVLAITRLESCGCLVLRASRAPTASNGSAGDERVRIWPRATAPHTNLCLDGRIAPELILLGAQRAASASLTRMLRCPQMSWAKVLPTEEKVITGQQLHIFDDTARFRKGKEFWLSHFPMCDQSKRIIAADATLDYLLTDNAPTVARRMFNWYGGKRTQLKFVVVLRDPLARVQSAFYRSAEKGWCKEGTTAGFRSYVERYITNNTQAADTDPCGFVKNTNYTHQLKAYFDVFLPGEAIPEGEVVPRHAQFIVIPFLDLVAETRGTEGRAVLGVWESLGLNVSSATAPPVEHMNEGSHPTLQVELGADLYAKAKTRVAKSIRYKGLAGMFTRGVSLPTFPGDRHHWDRVSQWLFTRW